MIESEIKPIPKIIHQIWLGPFDPPTTWTSKWQDFCDKYDWTYMFWNDSKIEEFKLTNKKEFDKAVSYQEKADIARYEIVYRYGGLYLDCDMIWLETDIQKYIPFDSANFIGVQEYPSMSLHKIQAPYLSNGFFAATVGNIILKRCIDEIPKRVKLSFSKYETFMKTGPTLLNKNVKEPIVVLPYNYVFPMDFHYKTNIEDPMVFKDKAIIFTYNGKEYGHFKKLEKFETKQWYNKLSNIVRTK